MDVKSAQQALHQFIQPPKENQAQALQPQVAAEADKKKQDLQSRQVSSAPPPPDSKQGQTFSKYA